MEHGYRAEVYGQPASHLADEMLRIAREGLDEGDLELLEPLAKLIEGRVTLADMFQMSDIL